jgi:hypothetical protein
MGPVPRSRRYCLGSLCFGLWALGSCAASYDSPSKVSTLRLLSLTADHSYALPGEEVTLRLTVADGLGAANDPARTPRDLQILWLGGCVDPAGDAFYLCFQQFAAELGSLGQGTPPPAGLIQLDLLPGSRSGEPDAVEYRVTMPDDIVTRRTPPSTGPYYGIAYVFFAACAGTIAPGDLTGYQGYSPDQGISLPLRCLDAAGNPQGADSFAVGYTQIYAFADGRRNANPPIDAMTLDGADMSEDASALPVVPPCALTASERKGQGCAREGLKACQSYLVDALIGDVAEANPGATDIDGNPLREIVWVDYFADRGDLGAELALVSDARTGYQETHDVEWFPPAEPGLVSIWAVARDQRGGATVMRRMVRVE